MRHEVRDSSGPWDPEDGYSESGVQPISSWMPLWLHVFCIFCPTTSSQRLREPKTSLRLHLTLRRFRFSSESRLCFPWDLPPLPPTLTSPASLCTTSQHNFCSLRGKVGERVTKSQQGHGLQKAWTVLLSGVSTAWFMRPSEDFAYAPVRQRIYLQRENNSQPRVLFSVPHRKI